MRILIDECIDERFRNSLPKHDCQTARYAGLAGLKKWRPYYSGGDSQIRRFPYRGSRYRIPAKFNWTKYRNYHFSDEVESSEGPVAARTRLPRVH
jgi:hypothetical protein